MCKQDERVGETASEDNNGTEPLSVMWNNIVVGSWILLHNMHDIVSSFIFLVRGIFVPIFHLFLEQIPSLISVCPQHTIPVILPMIPDEVQTLHFVGCSETGFFLK